MNCMAIVYENRGEKAGERRDLDWLPLFSAFLFGAGLNSQGSQNLGCLPLPVLLICNLCGMLALILQPSNDVENAYLC